MSPIALFESAAVYRLMGNLEQDRIGQERTVALVDEPALLNRPDNQERWEDMTDRAVVRLTELPD